MNIRKNDMSQWCGHTRRCDTLGEAMTHAQFDLQRTSHVSIWQMRVGWMVITYTSMLVN